MSTIDMKLQETFRKNVRRRRRELHLTQSALAKMLGVTQPTVTAIERGRRKPMLETVENFAAALNTSAIALLAESPEPV